MPNASARLRPVQLVVAGHETLPGSRCKWNFVPCYGIANQRVVSAFLRFPIRDVVGAAAPIIIPAANVDSRRLHALRLWFAPDCGALAQAG
jgi:hypothetical protein